MRFVRCGSFHDQTSLMICVKCFVEERVVPVILRILHHYDVERLRGCQEDVDLSPFATARIASGTRIVVLGREGDRSHLFR